MRTRTARELNFVANLYEELDRIDMVRVRAERFGDQERVAELTNKFQMVERRIQFHGGWDGSGTL